MYVYFLSHAGGSASSYLPLFMPHLPGWTLEALELPGHGRYITQPLLGTIDAMLDNLESTLHAALQRRLHSPYILVGHSMGALLSFLLTERMEKKGTIPLPQHLFLSSSCIPGRHYIESRLFRLSDAAFWQESASYFGGMSDEVVMNEDLRSLFVPVLKGDLQAVVAYKPGVLEAISVPITTFCGTSDCTDKHDMALWKRYTTGAFDFHCLQGSHFHIMENPTAMAFFLRQSANIG